MSIREQPLSQQADPGPISIRMLFGTFVEITLSSFGGAMAWAYRILVEKRRWLSERQFAELWSLAQALPGPNIVNLAMFMGIRFRGAPGAVVAYVGLVLVPLLIILPVVALYNQFGQVEIVSAVLRGIAVVAAGMLVAMGLKMVRPIQRDPWALAVAALAFIGVGLLRWPLIVVLAVLAPCSIAIAWRRLR